MLAAQGCRFVTRLKSNSPVSRIAERPVKRDGDILFDHIVRLNGRLSAQRRKAIMQKYRKAQTR
jgi:hypothetical protein